MVFFCSKNFSHHSYIQTSLYHPIASLPYPSMMEALLVSLFSLLIDIVSSSAVLAFSCVYGARASYDIIRLLELVVVELLS